MRHSMLTATTALAALTILVLAGCGVGAAGPEAKISETTDKYFRALSSRDTTKACAQLTARARRAFDPSCSAAMEKIATRVGTDRLAHAADEGSSISVDGSSGSATPKGLNGVRLGLVAAEPNWLIDSGFALEDRQ